MGGGTPLIIIISFFTLLNLIISAYMTWQSALLAWHCRCAMKNFYWFYIFLYFIFSVYFLFYSLMYSLDKNDGTYFFGLFLAYVITTFMFVTGAYAYTIYIKNSKTCQCMDKKYESVLLVVSYIRFLMAILGAFTLLAWIVYWFLTKGF